MAGKLTNPVNDGEITENRPTDGVSSLSWSPRSDHIAAGSWDCKIRCWEVTPPSPTALLENTEARCSSAFKVSYAHEAPVLTTCWRQDGGMIFSAGCDKKACSYSLETGEVVTIGKHDAPIKTLHYFEEINALISGSWDKTVKFWDCRTHKPGLCLDATERVFCADLIPPLLVVATAQRRLLIFDIRVPSRPYRSFSSPLKYQSRSLACFPDKTGFALGSIEGRCAIHHVEDTPEFSRMNFAFKCHRQKTDQIYAVNDISFHPVYGTFATCGSDGVFTFWDKDSKQRLKPFPAGYQPITQGKFNGNGKVYAYAMSYDWSKGSSHYDRDAINHIYLHAVQDNEIRNRGGRHR